MCTTKIITGYMNCVCVTKSVEFNQIMPIHQFLVLKIPFVRFTKGFSACVVKMCFIIMTVAQVIVVYCTLRGRDQKLKFAFIFIFTVLCHYAVLWKYGKYSTFGKHKFTANIDAVVQFASITSEELGARYFLSEMAKRLNDVGFFSILFATTSITT